MTTFSPWIEGNVAVRRSMGRPETRRLTLPSWGTRRSAMLSSDMILIRLTTALAIERGVVMTSWRTPSILNRTRRSRSPGSMWMSEARSLTARVMIVFMSLTTGASSAALSRNAPPSSSSWPSAASSARSDTDSSNRDWRRIASSRSVRVATRGEMSIPETARRSSMARTFAGSARATTSRSSSNPMGSAVYLSWRYSGTVATAAGSIVTSARSTYSIPIWRASVFTR